MLAVNVGVGQRRYLYVNIKLYKHKEDKRTSGKHLFQISCKLEHKVTKKQPLLEVVGNIMRN